MMKNLILAPEEVRKINQRTPALAAGYDCQRENALNAHYNMADHVTRDFKGNPIARYIKVEDDGPYVNSAEFLERWDKIENLRKSCNRQMIGKKSNVMTFPDDYYDLVQQVLIDLTRRRVDAEDYTGIISNETTNLAAPNPVPIKEMLPFAGKFGEYKAGQHINMIQEKTGSTDSFPLGIYALGFERDLYSVLFDIDIFSMQKVMAAVTRSHKGLRNSLVFDPMIAASIAGTWHASQVQAAYAAGPTYDYNLYKTIFDAYKLLSTLKDMQTGQEIKYNRTILVVDKPITAWVINNVINGQLRGVGTNSLTTLSPIPINQIIAYQGDSWIWGEQIVNYPGVPANTAYLLVPGTDNGPYWTLNKAPLTQETGRGSVLTLGQEQKAWWFSQGKYYDEFMGSTGDATTEADFGYVVTIELPEETET